MKKTITQRGFNLIEFKDIYDDKCSIQESSLATKRAIWVGADEVTKDHCSGTVMNSRMHLDRKLSFLVALKLLKFSVFGEL